MRVKEVMSADVVTVDLDETVATAAERMLRRDVGSVVVMHEGAPAGILTESDAMRAGVVTGAPFSEIPIRQAASSSLETIVPTTTVRTAAKRMVSAEVKKLVVVDDLELRGIVTMSDLVRNQHDIVREARQLDAKRTEWES
ncbi:CBS domain-containing protein [Halorubrum luteum]